MSDSGFVRRTGIALSIGGALTILVNAVLTPAMHAHAPFVETAASPVFVWRQSASAIAVAFLLFGSLGLQVVQGNRVGKFGTVAFGMTFLGCALVLASEWAEVFVVHTLA